MPLGRGRRGRVLLDPCAGSGTAAIAGNEYGMRSILIERDARYAELIEHRVRGSSGSMGHSERQKGDQWIDSLSAKV
jgi:DNA modification methylase